MWDEWKVNFTCSGLSLTAIPREIPFLTVNFDLSGNKIKIINKNDFQGCSQIVMLDLSYNDIFTSIHPNAFTPLSNLRILKIIKSLKDPMVLQVNFSRDLPDLQSLAIQNNFIETSVNFSIQDFSRTLDLFPVGLVSLELDIPPDINFVSELTKFTNLKKLGLFCKKSFPLHIANATFKALSNSSIKALRIHSDTFSMVEPLAFFWFPHLKNLDLSHSRGMSVADLYPAWYGLKNSKLEVLNLESFRVTNNFDFINLNSTFFKHFNFVTLEKCILESTRIGNASVWEFAP